MTKRTEPGFAHSPDSFDGVDAKLRTNEDGDVTVSFDDGSPNLNIPRREFLRISGVAAATAAMTGAGCSEWRNDVDYVVPYVDRPEEIRIGTPNYYASVCTGCSAGCGMLVTTRGGRPVKLEGNPRHPIGRGGLCSRGQASYMDVYDPDRARTPLKVSQDGRHTELAWDEMDRVVTAAIEKAAKGGGVALLTQTFTGSARQGLIKDLTSALSGVKHYTYETLTSEAVLAASETCFGDAHIPHYDFSKAGYVVSLGSDFLGTWLSPVEFTKQFSQRRNPEGDMAKLVAFEGALTLTGANADERFRVKATDLAHIGLALAHTVIVTRRTGPLAANTAVASALAAHTPEAVAKGLGIDADALKRVGQELADNAGKSLVVAGGLANGHDGGVGLEIVVNLLNAALGNEGVTVDRSSVSRQGQGSLAELKQLVADINAGKIDVLIINGANPLYGAPADLGLAEALKKVNLVVSTSDRVDETSLHAQYLAPAGNPMESWGDSNPVDGVYSIIQPSLRPLHSTRGFEHSLMVWFGTSLPTKFDAVLAAPDAPAGPRAEGVPTDPGPWYRYLRAHWQSTVYPKASALGGFDAFWNDTLRKGVFTTKSASAKPRFNVAKAASGLPKWAAPEASGDVADLSAKTIELVATVGLYDGSSANNGHLQELPDPITKTVWNSFAMISAASFKAAGLKQGQMIKIKVGDAERSFPAIIQPGLHDDIIALPLGFGRTGAGVIGNDIGANAFDFTAQTADGRQVFKGIKADAISATDEVIHPPIVQGGQVLDIHRRPLFASTTLEEYKAKNDAGVHAHPPLKDMWDAHDYTLKWGMAVDMTKCTGCSACVTACQEENNIPVVGLQGILEGREMHWMRIDRYYSIPHSAEKAQQSPTHDPLLAGDQWLHDAPVVALAEHLDEPRVFMQPMMCQHCENAPCETVCPVSATMHSADGLNQMIYNRCVGTRYCSNNCPFKVRRYNWFSYTSSRADTVFARFYPELERHEQLNVTEPLPMNYNPEVTVRSRGVMEKCTFCVQRIRRANWQLREEGRSQFRDGDVVTACQQSCPADAISFGNLVDETSNVAKLHAKARATTPLEEINVKSSVAYLTSVWNTAPAVHHDEGHGEDHGDKAEGHGEAH